MAVFEKYIKKDGSTAYMFKAYLGVDPETGKKRKTTRRGFKSEREAKLALSRLEVDVAENGIQSVISKASNESTFEEIYELWMKQYENTVKESTFIRTEQNYRIHILPAFGDKKISKIKADYCQKIINEWCSKYTTFGLLKNQVNNIFEHAVKMKLIKENPMSYITVPKRKPTISKDDNFLNKTELKHFFECLEKHSDLKHILIFRLLAFCGLRKGELLALTWKEIDFTNKTLSVKKTVTKTQDGFQISTPKTKASIRVLPLDQKTINILKLWKKEQSAMFLKFGMNITKNKEQLIFTASKAEYVNKPMCVHYINNFLIGFCKKHNIRKIGVHGFRHTHASLLFESGADIKDVQNRLGHSSVKTTMDIYTHISKERQEKIIDQYVRYIDF